MSLLRPAGGTVGLEAYTEAGLQNVTYTFYPGGRHEMLNEINKMEVYKDIVDWLQTTQFIKQ